MRFGACCGMTLVELLVAAAILVIVIASMGYVYSQTSAAVGVTNARVEVNAKFRSISARLRDDLQAFTPDGLLVIAGPTPSAVPGVHVSSMLMLTVAGRFESRICYDGRGKPITANAALIVYVPAHVAANAGHGDILCRYVYLLTGDRRWPANLRELSDLTLAADPTDLNALDGCDVLGDTLADLRHKSIIPGAGSVWADYLGPVLDRFGKLNPAPAAHDDPVAGGVAQLWPYLVGGCDGMELEFCDGLAADAATPAISPLDWFRPFSGAAVARKDRAGIPLRALYDHRACLCWTPARRDLLPLGLRIRLKLQDVAGRISGRWCEIVVPIRR